MQETRTTVDRDERKIVRYIPSGKSLGEVGVENNNALDLNVFLDYIRHVLVYFHWKWSTWINMIYVYT